MNVIEELYNNQRSYFFEVDDSVLKVGGRNAGRYYGELEINFSSLGIVIYRDVSDGISSSMTISPLQYSKDTNEYDIARKLKTEVKQFLNSKEGRAYQEEHREALMANTGKLLPQYQQL